MHHKRRESSPEQELSYFEVQSYWGSTKHAGALKSTRELIELCHIGKAGYVLEVGCEVGITSCYLAKKHGCRVVGVDISEKMIDWSNERARREGVENSVRFEAADAQNLPFEDALFDVVIGESVIAFLEDKQRGVGEYVRVTKPGGYVGLNEVTWIKVPPINRTFSATSLAILEGYVPRIFPEYCIDFCRCPSQVQPSGDI